MTKEQPGRRRIMIEDKRTRDETGGNGAPQEALQPAADAVSADDLASLAGTPAVQPDAARDGAALEQPQQADWEQRAAEYLDLAQRKEAELRNYIKRVQQDLEDARRFAVEGLLSDLFPALDGLAQAAHTYRERPDSEDPLLDGVRRTVRAVEAALNKHGISKINTAGVPFDPQMHHALNVEESSDVTEDTVAEVYVEGYRMGSIVLKPAMVKVVKPIGQ